MANQTVWTVIVERPYEGELFLGVFSSWDKATEFVATDDYAQQEAYGIKIVKRELDNP